MFVPISPRLWLLLSWLTEMRRWTKYRDFSFSKLPQPKSTFCSSLSSLLCWQWPVPLSSLPPSSSWQSKEPRMASSILTQSSLPLKPCHIYCSILNSIAIAPHQIQPNKQTFSFHKWQVTALQLYWLNYHGGFNNACTFKNLHQEV